MNISATEKDIKQEAARRYLADKAYLYILGKSQAAKLRQVMKGVDIDVVTMRLIRDVMMKDDRFETVDRRWAATVRFGESRRPFERVLSSVLQAAGVPLQVNVLAQELAEVYKRTAEYYEQALPRILADTEKFFMTESGTYGLATWLIIPTSEKEEDVVFDNFVSESQLAEYTELCPEVKWDMESIADSAFEVVKGCKEPVPAKILALIAWRSLGDFFDPIDFYSQLVADERLMILSNQKLYLADAAKGFIKTLGAMAEELAALPMEAEEEEAEGPIVVTDTDKEEVISMILDKGSASVEELLEAVLEVNPSESGYAGALESLNEALTSDERIMWVGGSRWSKVVTFPEDVLTVPESLVVPSVAPFETPEGDVFDQMLEIDGFEGDLKTAIYDPLAEDVTDEDAELTSYQKNGDSQKCVLKYHHKIEGTFPLCQINPEFFGTEPEIIPIVLVDEGKRKNIFVNNNTRLIYGLKDFYKDITEISGAVFHIEKTAKPGEYRFRFDNEADDQLGIDTGRSLELVDLKSRFESQDMPIYDVITEILQRQPATFPRLVNEVNIVRRCSRLLIASILSSYHAFNTRGKSGLWQYDEKKRSQGFNKTKRKYIKKD